jgi:hypothetical protein
MTRSRSAEERIERWLKEDAVGSLPDRVFDATFERLRGTRQAGRPAWRPFSMSRPFSAMIAIGAAAIVVAVGGALLLMQARPDPRIGPPRATATTETLPAGVLDATASLDLEVVQPVTPHAEPPVPAPRQLESGSFSGTIEVAVAGRTISGVLRLDTTHELEYSLTGPVVNHAWGSATGELNGAACDGSIAFTYFRGGPAGGTMFLRCADGTIVGGRVDSVDVALADSKWRLTARVNGSYAGGG